MNNYPKEFIIIEKHFNLILDIISEYFKDQQLNIPLCLFNQN